MVQPLNGPVPRPDRLAGLHCLLNHSAILVDDPSLRKLLAFAALPLSRAVYGVDRDVDRRWTSHRLVARSRTLLEPAGLGASRLPLRCRILALFAIREAFHRDETQRISRDHAGKST